MTCYGAVVRDKNLPFHLGKKTHNLFKKDPVKCTQDLVSQRDENRRIPPICHSMVISTPRCCVFDEFENSHHRVVDPSKNVTPTNRFQNPMGRERDSRKVLQKILQNFDFVLRKLQVEEDTALVPVEV